MNIAFFADIDDNHNQKWFQQLRQNHRLLVFTQATAVCKQLEGVTVYPILPPFPLLNFKTRNAIMRDIRAILQREKVQVVHSIYAMPFAIWAHESGFSPHILTTYGSDVLIDFQKLQAGSGVRQLLANWLLRRRFRKAVRAAFAVTSTSESQRRAVDAIAGFRKHAELIRTGVAAQEFIGMVAKHRNSFPPRTILSVRAMQPLYNIERIVEGFDLLNESNPEKYTLELVTYGAEPEYLQKIKKLISDLRLSDRVKFLPPLGTDELAAAYARAALVVMIPLSDGTPVTGVECLLAQTPLLMGDLAYDQDIFTEETVWFANRHDATDFGLKMQEILSSDPQFIADKTAKGQEAAVAGADLTVQIAKLERLYESSLGRK